jgi:hypothetical protein
MTLPTLSDRIFAKVDIDRAYEDIDIPEWEVKVRIIEPDARTRADLAGGFDRGQSNLDLGELYASVLIATLVDPETGDPIFVDADKPNLLRMSGQVVDRVALKAMKVAGLTDEAVEQGKEPSSSTPSDEVSTDSPST